MGNNSETGELEGCIIEGRPTIHDLPHLTLHEKRRLLALIKEDYTLKIAMLYHLNHGGIHARQACIDDLVIRQKKNHLGYGEKISKDRAICDLAFKFAATTVRCRMKDLLPFKTDLSDALKKGEIKNYLKLPYKTIEFNKPEPQITKDVFFYGNHVKVDNTTFKTNENPEYSVTNLLKAIDSDIQIQVLNEFKTREIGIFFAAPDTYIVKKKREKYLREVQLAMLQDATKNFPNYFVFEGESTIRNFIEKAYAPY